MHLGVVGINHKLAELPLREQVAKVCQRRFGAPYLLLSTCNRTEIYFYADSLSDKQSEIISCLRDEIGDEFEQRLYSFFGDDCFLHLARVTAGLDSAIVGETEIQGQVKAIYEQTRQACSLPADVHYLFQKCLRIGKQIRSSITFTPITLDEALLNLAKDHFPDLKKRRILFVGASEINTRVIHRFKSAGMETLAVCNRSDERGSQFASRLEIETLAWNRLDLWHTYDIVVCGTKSPEPLITTAPFPLGKKLIADLAVPRNVAPSLADHPSISLFNVDQITAESQPAGTYSLASEMIQTAVDGYITRYKRPIKFSPSLILAN